jgi:hypothetical protein
LAAVARGSTSTRPIFFKILEACVSRVVRRSDLLAGCAWDGAGFIEIAEGRDGDRLVDVLITTDVPLTEAAHRRISEAIPTGVAVKFAFSVPRA